MSESNVFAIPPPEVADAFTSAVITALQELTQTEAFAEPLSPSVVVEAGNIVLATVRLVRAMPGRMTLVLASETASRLAAQYLPPGTILNDEIIDDVVGEFANVIAGQSKTILKGTPYHFTLSTPVVARAASFHEWPGAEGSKLVVSVATQLGQVLLLADLPPCPNA